jgi:arylsulfatase A-like enzyme
MYADVKVPIPRSLHKTPEQTPRWAAKTKGVSEASLARIMPGYYGMVKCIDDNVGKILTTLRKYDLIDNTVIVFTADHGDLCGEHGRLNKGVPYEGSAKVPFVIYFPAKIQAATVVGEALSCVDFLPTVISLMGLETRGTEEGRDASALFIGKTPRDWKDVAFLRSTGKTGWLCAVSDDYKLVYSPHDDPWLFDLKNDPDELDNRFGEPEYREVVQQLTRALIQYCRDHQDPNGQEPKIQAAMAAAVGLGS